MSFAWSEFLALAESLRHGPDLDGAGKRLTEACWRTAVSRAYYAAFHEARDRYRLFWTNTLPDHRQGTSHLDVLRAYRTRARLTSDPMVRATAELVAALLFRLRRSRVRADYEPAMRRPGKAARLAVQDAQVIQRALQKLERS